MLDRWTDLSSVLANQGVEASAPCRVDCGGSTDHRLTGLLCRTANPVTATIALDLRTTVRLEPHTPGRLAVESTGLGDEDAALDELPLDGPLALGFAVLASAGVHGVKAVIDAPVPARSGLGTSGTVAVALIGALQSVLRETREREDAVRFAHHVEDSLYGNTGLQDQASAMYGGAALYRWRYDGTLAFTREPLVDNSDTLARHMLVAHTGKPHASTRSGTLVIQAIKKTGRLTPLIEISEHTRVFADAVRRGAFSEAAEALNREASVRAAFLRPFSAQEDEELVTRGRDVGCGVRVAGRGSGGAVWAMGPEDAISRLRDEWRAIFAERGFGQLLATTPTMDGLRVSPSA